ncbi:MAG: DUF6152 family protein [Alcaligenaceae bacterium]|nr:DUF6152 family protein [Alcaligenaceae bacterium]
MPLKSLLGVLALSLLAGPAWAHHGWSAYDTDKAMKLEAPLTAVRYRNPHAQVTIQHQGRDWEVILAPTRRMETRGLPKEALQKGKVVTIEGYPRRDGTPEIRAERITVDGKTVELR